MTYFPKVNLNLLKGFE